MKITRQTIAQALREERQSRVWSNQEVQQRVDGLFFDARTDIGGYPIVFYAGEDTQNGSLFDTLCADCAREEVRENRASVYSEVYWEGPVLYCEGCNAAIESAYGDPDDSAE